MGDKSTIEWTDATWNPVVGCSKVSPGCAHCYAEELHRTRLGGTGVYPAFRPWTPENAEHNVTLAPDRLDQPLRWTKPRMVFVNSMSDLFHELVPEWYIARVFGVMAASPRHTFQVLTKRPERMAAMLGQDEVSDFWREVWRYAAEVDRRHEAAPALLLDTYVLTNVWLGTSIENHRFVGRADQLRAVPAHVRFISAEPLLGPLVHDDEVLVDACGETRTRWSDYRTGPELDLTDIDWLIVGGESGVGHRPIRTEWVVALRDAAEVAGTAFFLKQWGGRTPKARGRELEGRTWDQMPERVAAAR